MPAHPIHERLVPYRILFYLLYAPTGDTEWLETVSNHQVRVYTGDAARELRMKNEALWRALDWLEDNHMITKGKETKRGTVLVTLKQPTNIKLEGEA